MTYISEQSEVESILFENPQKQLTVYDYTITFISELIWPDCEKPSRSQCLVGILERFLAWKPHGQVSDMASSIWDQFMESMGSFFSGKAVWYGGTGTGSQITGNPTGGSGSGSSFVPGYDENGVYIDMEVVGTPQSRPMTLEYYGFVQGQITLVAMGCGNPDGSTTWFEPGTLRTIHIGTPDSAATEEFEFDWPSHPEVTVGTAGNDLITGRDILIGGGGNDTIIGSAGVDILVAGTGNNILEGGAGADLLDGTGGWAVAFYQRALTAVTVHLDGSGNAGDQAAGDRYINVNGVNGSNFNDTLVGISRATG